MSLSGALPLVSSSGSPAQPPRSGSRDSSQKLRVFISYSRADLEFADQLDAALELTGFDSTMDRQGIHGGEEWQGRLGNLIRDADTIVFILSPTSAASKICAWEVEEAARHGKRIIPVCCRPLEEHQPPELLASRNYIFFYAEPKAPGSGFGTGLAKLVEALNTDLDWLREHTRLLQRATEWETGGRLANRLLSGHDISAAKAWAARRPKDAPEPTLLHLDYIRASEQEEEKRQNTERQKLADMAAAQDERAKALSAAEEAFKQAAEAHRRRDLIRNTAMAAVTAIALIAVYFWSDAERARDSIAYLLNNARDLITRVSQRLEFKKEEYKVAVDLFKKGDELGDPAATYMLAFAYENGWSVEQNETTAMDLLRKSAEKNHPPAIYALAERQAASGEEKDVAEARRLFEKAAELSDGDTLYAIAVRYEHGDGVAQSTTRAIDLYLRAANRDNVQAMRWLAEAYLTGTGLVKDDVKGRNWLEKAALKDDVTAIRELAEMYETGRSVPQDFGKTRQLLERAAALDDTASMRKLALMYENAKGVPADEAAARAWFERSVAKDSASALTDIGVLYENGQDVKKDFVKARSWYQAAADKGDPRGMIYLADLVQEGKDGTERDPKQARQLYEKAAALGTATAMSRLGFVHLFGIGVEANGAQAVDWLTRAADQDDTYAMNLLGLAYQEAMAGLPRDFKTARQWYDKAAGLGSVDALSRIGNLYEYGFGVEKNYDEARSWYQKAVEQESAWGYFSLGVLAYYGYGESADFLKAKGLFEKAAALGDADAPSALGVMYRNGQGVPRDYAKAREAFEKAVELKSAVAAVNLAALYSEGLGVTRDFSKARHYVKIAADFNDFEAPRYLEQLDIDELTEEGRFATALVRQTALREKTEAREVARLGRPEGFTAAEIWREARLLLLNREPQKALDLSEQAIARLDEDYAPHITRAHALMFLGRNDEAKDLYTSRKGKLVASHGYTSWEHAVELDFNELTRHGVTHPLMTEIRDALNIPR